MSNYNLALRLAAEPLRSLAFGSISGTYMGIGNALANPNRIFHMQNLTDVLLFFSLDGITDHFAINTNGFLLVDVSSNKSTLESYYLPQGMRFYVRAPGADPTSGAVYLTVFYGAGV